LNYLRRLYTYILVDTSSILTDPTLAAIDGGDLVVLLTNQDIPSIKNARLFLDLAEVLKINRKRILFIMNRFDRRIGITPDKVGESFKHPIAATLPLEERVVIPSINRGRPFILDDKSRPITRAMLSLAEVVRQRLAELAQAESKEEMIVGTKVGRIVKR
jgi:pilus assembly protein CpaE